jgi:hypothetical protein
MDARTDRLMRDCAMRHLEKTERRLLADRQASLIGRDRDGANQYVFLSRMFVPFRPSALARHASGHTVPSTAKKNAEMPAMSALHDYPPDG